MSWLSSIFHRRKKRPAIITKPTMTATPPKPVVPTDVVQPTPMSTLLRPTAPLVNRIPSDVVLNADRPADDSAPATGSAPSAPMSSHIAQLPAMNATATAPFDWKKYLPWILIALVVLAILFASRRKSAS